MDPIASAQRLVGPSFLSGVRRLPESVRRASMSGPTGGLLAGQIINGMAREYDANRGGDLAVTIRWEVGDSGDRNPQAHDLVIAEGRCRVRAASEPAPHATIGLSRLTLLDLALGLTNGPQAYMAGDLRLKGDVSLAARLGDLFTVPGNRSRDGNA